MQTIKRFGMNKHTLFLTLIKRDGMICGICGKSMEQDFADYFNWRNKTFSLEKKERTKKRTHINVSVDHINPYSLSKNNNLDNLQLAHIDCNKNKGNSFPQVDDIYFLTTKIVDIY